MFKQACIAVVVVVAGAAVAGSSWSRRSHHHFGEARPPHFVLPGETPNGEILATGWRISPVGTNINLKGDMPSRIVLLPGGKTAAVLLSGYHDQGVEVIDVASRTSIQFRHLGSSFCGLSVSGNNLYVSLGSQGIGRYPVKDGLLGELTKITLATLPKNAWIGGLASLPSGEIAAADLNHDCVDILSADGSQIRAAIPTGRCPFALATTAKGGLVATNWGDESVSFIDPLAARETYRLKVGSHPNDVLCSPDGRVFVTNGGGNSVSSIFNGKVIETILTSLSPRDEIGSTPIALALAPDGHRLYAANADNNDVAVISLRQPDQASSVIGFIPTAWYPSALAVTRSGELLVGTAKGTGIGPNVDPVKSRMNPAGQIPFRYIALKLAGQIRIVADPNDKDLALYTKKVYSNIPNRALAMHGRRGNRQMTQILGQLKHVIFVIRENRTYDQVLGDDARGNGDPSLVMFGANVTPNAHRLAKDFVLLDNLYCDGEVSEDGHQWCDSAYATDFTEKAWENRYAGRRAPDADDRLTASPGGYLWDNCERHGRSYFSYGESANFEADKDHAPVFKGDKGLEGHASLAWSSFKTANGECRDYQRINVFLDDLEKAEKSGKWPNYTVMSLGEDHTVGLRSGGPTPAASMASNDLALGKLVDAVTHSRFWKDTAILVIEDDGQNGPDHVDAHRTVGLFISPFTKRGAVDETMYSTASFLRTAELILGLPPMTQFDSTATPLFASLSAQPDYRPYDAVAEMADLQAKNGNTTALNVRSDRLDFSGYDRANPDELNAILWESIHPGVPEPAPVRRLRMAQ